MSSFNKSIDTKKITYLALLTAIVAVLQCLAVVTRLLGIFSFSFVLIPIVIGAAICGPLAGAWLGAVFGVMVFITGDAVTFLQFDVFGTVITVMLKGILSGFFAGAVYRALDKINRYFAVFVSAVICPVVNTGVFIGGCYLFFLDDISVWATSSGLPVGVYIITVLVASNFIFELISSIILAPIAVRIINVKKHE
jgi:uncharacterized membrane protein